VYKGKSGGSTLPPSLFELRRTRRRAGRVAVSAIAKRDFGDNINPEAGFGAKPASDKREIALPTGGRAKQLGFPLARE